MARTMVASLASVSRSRTKLMSIFSFDRQLLEITERGVAGTEVVDRDTDPSSRTRCSTSVAIWMFSTIAVSVISSSSAPW